MEKGAEFETLWKHPGCCWPEERQLFHDMVVLGGEVTSDGFLGRIERAERLIFCRSGQLVVGVAGLKKAGQHYRADTGKKADLDLSEERWPLEFGWAFICPGARGKGLSHRMLATGLDGISVPVFATSRADNPHMHAPLRAAGFVQAGREYRSDRHGGPMLVFQRSVGL
jgi:hypothetical protein